MLIHWRKERNAEMKSHWIRCVVLYVKKLKIFFFRFLYADAFQHRAMMKSGCFSLNSLTFLKNQFLVGLFSMKKRRNFY